METNKWEDMVIVECGHAWADGEMHRRNMM